MKLTTQPDGQKKSNLGVGLEVAAGENKLVCQKDGSPVKARVLINKPDGTVAHEGEGTLDKFTFG